jgi:hypothetical protein
VVSALEIGKRMLGNTYLRRTYVTKRDDELTRNGREVKKLYGRVVTLLDEIAAIRKSRMERPHPPGQE